MSINRDREMQEEESRVISGALADNMEANLNYHAAMNENHKEWLLVMRAKAEKEVEIAEAKLALIESEIRLYESVLGDDWGNA